MRDEIYILLATLCFGLIGILVKLIGTEIPNMTLAFYRLFLGFIFLLLVIPFFDKNVFKINKKDIKDFLLIGILFAASLTLTIIALTYVPVQNVSLIGGIYPFFVLIFAYFWLKEKITWTKIITLVIAIAGLAIINPFKLNAQFIGNIAALASAVALALIVTKMRYEDRTHSASDVLWFLFFGSLVLLPFPFIYGLGNLKEVWMYVLLLGFVSTGLAYLLYNFGLKKIEAETASIIDIISSPIISILLAVLIISEQINFRIIIGGALLITAGAYLELHNKQLKK